MKNKVAIGLSRVSGMFRCDRTDSIKSRALRKEFAPGEYHVNSEMRELLEMLENYNPREHIIHYQGRR